MPAKREVYKVDIDTATLEAARVAFNDLSVAGGNTLGGIKLGTFKTGVDVSVVFRKVNNWEPSTPPRWQVFRISKNFTGRNTPYNVLNHTANQDSKVSTSRRQLSGDEIDLETDADANVESVIIRVALGSRPISAITAGDLEVRLLVLNPDDATPGFVPSVSVPALRVDLLN